MLSAIRSAKAWIVDVTFTPPDVTPDAALDVNRFFTSWQRPPSFTTERSASVSMRAVPRR
jgi:hypothetical protein